MSGYPPPNPGQNPGYPGQNPGYPGQNPGYPGQYPPGAMPPGYPTQGMAPGMNPTGAMPPGYPQGAYPQGAYPQGAYPQGAYPPGAMAPRPGMYPPGAMPPGAMQPGAYPGYMGQGMPGAMPGGMPGAMPMAHPFPAYCFDMKRMFEIKQKFFSLTGDMKIKDQTGRELFVVKQDFSVGVRMHFLDHHTHQEICYIVQEFRLGYPHFDIFRGGMLYATVKFKGNRMQPEFEVDLKHPFYYGQELKFKGDFLAYNWDILRQGMLVGWIRKEYFAVTDSYGVEVEANEDAILVLATAVVIDKCLHDESVTMGMGGMGGGVMVGGGFVQTPVVEVVQPGVVVENFGMGFGVPGFGVNIGFGGGHHHHHHHRGW